jgi:hypothetical protein
MTPPPDERPFEDDLDVAETATSGVCFNLAVGDMVSARALQPVARAAWGLVEDGGTPRELLREARRARADLELVCGAWGERLFLDNVIAYAEGRRRRRPRKLPEAGEAT